MPPPANLSDLSRAELEARFVELLGEVSELKQIVAAQRDEIARLKGLKGRPSIKPSGMENATGPKRGGKRAKRRRRGKVTPRVVPETEVLRVAHPTGSQFKGYEPYQVQELVLTARVVRYRRERWLTPEGETIVAPLPSGIRGHFGPELRRFVLMQYHQGQVTVERLVAQLQAIGVSISKRQLMRLLIDRQDDFLTETREVLRAGLETADWITVDDTGARHRGANGVCTQIGNDNFAWFGTTGSKSRLNFLDLLRAGHTDYAINDAALEYMREHALAGTLVQRLATHKRRQFADEQAWTRHLERLGIAGLAVTPDPVRVATEGALWGAVNAHGFLCEAVVVSDDAGQFNVGQHALCWIHAERLVHKLETFTDQQRVAQQHVGRVAQHARPAVAQMQVHADRGAHRPADQVRHSGHERVRVHRLRLQPLPPREGEQPPRQPRRPVHRLAGRLEVAQHLRGPALAGPAPRHVQAARDALEHVVEVVRDAARQLAHRLHLLHLPQRRLGALALRRLRLQAVQGLPQLGGALGDLRFQLLAAAGQHLAGAHLVVDIGRGAEPLENAACRVPHRRGAALEPAPCPSAAW